VRSLAELRLRREAQLPALDEKRRRSWRTDATPPDRAETPLCGGGRLVAEF